MWTRIGLILLLLAGTGVFSAPRVHASCVVETTSGPYVDGDVIHEDKCDANGNKKVTGAGASGITTLGTSTAAAPSLVEGAQASFSFDNSGNARFTLGTLISGEDQTNNLLMTSGGAVRVTQILGTGSIPSTASDATSATSILPIGKKTFQGVVTCTGTCVQTQKIYGTWQNSTSYGEELCTLNLNQSTTAHASCIVDTAWMYYFVITTNTSGTTPLSGIFAQY